MIYLKYYIKKNICQEYHILHVIHSSIQLYRSVTVLGETKIIRNAAKFGKIRFFTEFEKWHSGSEFEEQNSAVGSNIWQNLPTFKNQCLSLKTPVKQNSQVMDPMYGYGGHSQEVYLS